MADSKLSDLTAATSVADADLLYVAQGGVSKKATVSLVRTYIQLGTITADSATASTASPVLLMGSSGYGLSNYTSSTSGLLYGNGSTFPLFANVSRLTLTSGAGMGFTSSATNATAALDTYFTRDAASTMSMRDLSNAQIFRVYGTYSDASNYERLGFRPAAASGWMQVAAETAGSGADNIGVALTPAGTGAISAHVPDSGTGGGNARGTNAVDWQQVRAAAGRVASGAYSTIAGGRQNTASGSDSTVGGGTTNTASGLESTIAGGTNNAASADYSTIAGGSQHTASAAGAAVGGGNSNTASGIMSWVPGGFFGTTRGLYGAYAYASGRRSATGDAQVIGQPVRRTTTDATPVSLATDGTPAATTVMVVPDGAVMFCSAMVVAKPSASITDGVGFTVEATVYRSGSTTALLSTPVTTVHGTNALALNATIVVDNATNESVEIQVTGAAATTIYWAGELKCVQVL